MTILQFVLMLAVAGFVIWAVTKALAGDWQNLIIGVVVLLVGLWVLGALGLTLPNLPAIR